MDAYNTYVFDGLLESTSRSDFDFLRPLVPPAFPEVWMFLAFAVVVPPLPTVGYAAALAYIMSKNETINEISPSEIPG